MHNAFTYVNSSTSQCYSFIYSKRNLVLVACQCFELECHLWIILVDRDLTSELSGGLFLGIIDL